MSKINKKQKPRKSKRTRNNVTTRGRPQTVAEAHRIMEQNAAVYVQSIFNPFEIKGARIPDATPYPSTVGSSVLRYTSLPVTDLSYPSQRMMGFIFDLDLTYQGAWIWQLTGLDAGEETWTYQVHPMATTFETNFHLIRTVSMGVRVVNVTSLLKRGGAIFVAHTADKVGPGMLGDLKLADDTEVYDLARMEAEGIEAVWIPLSRTTVRDSSTSQNPSGSTYVNPTINPNPPAFDAKIVIWAEISDNSGEALDFRFEQHHNWEAVPYSYTSPLFESKTVTGSSDGIGEMLMASLGSTGIPNSAKTVISNAGQSLAKYGRTQIENYAMGILSKVPGMVMSALDFSNHVMAVHTRQLHLSPVNNTKCRRMSKEQFLAMLVRAIARQKKKTSEDKPEKEKQPENDDEFLFIRQKKTSQ